jgi:ribosomal protein S18 acetylase RimI-like enzyme
MIAEKIHMREEVRPSDPAHVRDITESTGFFYPDEVQTAVELVEERLARGIRSGYHFLFAEQADRAVGYTSFGLIACTRSSWDLYWIAVHADMRGKGLGTALLEESERRIAAMGGSRVYIETSARSLYEPTRAFYLARGYREEARLPDYYAPGDAKVIYVKVL